MSCLQVLVPGLFTTIQDLGRPGYAHLGVSASGAADPLALRLGNLLVGNPENAAALEMTVAGGLFKFPEGATLALMGGDFKAQLDGRPVTSGVTQAVGPGASLQVGHSRTGARSYLCVRGGIRVPLFLGSASTHFLSGLGGVAGRPLRTGDLLRIGREPRSSARKSLRQQTLDNLAHRAAFRVTAGPQSNRFSESVRREFFSSEYTVTEQANRMGLRLHGAPLHTVDGTSVLSQGVACGSLQVTNSGQPLILFVEQQTTGGYPVIASVASVDLPFLGQLRPGDRIRFEPIDTAEALALFRQQERWIATGELFE